MTSFMTQAVLHWTAVGFYIVATVTYAHALIFDHPERARWGAWLSLVGLVPHTAALAMRWIASGHGPYMMRYEVLSSNAWVAVILLLLAVARRSSWRPLALVVLPVACLAMAIGLFANPEIRELPPTLRSVWLVFHVSFAKLAAGAFLLAVACAVLLLWGRRGRLAARLPDDALLDASLIRFVGFGFLFWTINVAAGAIWANESWGRYWGWDPIESWSLVTWLAWGSLLHARFFFKLGPRQTAHWTLVCFGVVLMTLFVFPFLFPSLHAAYFQ